MRFTTRAQNPKRDEDCEKASQVQTEHQALNEGEVLGQEGVEDEDKEHHGNHDQSAVPPLVDVVLIVENDETLNLSCSQERPDCYATLPAECAEPANEV